MSKNKEDSMMNEENPFASLPGILIKNSSAALIIQRFRKAYRVYTDERPSNIPTWCTFPEGRQITWDEFYTKLKELSTDKRMYFYREGGDHEKYTLKHATATEIEVFFTTRQPWQDKDYYIFDESFRYCIAITHDDDIIFVTQMENEN